jgi:hypothetical protein
MIHHSYRGITGQDLYLVVTNNTTASLGVIHVCGSTFSRSFIVPAELIPPTHSSACGIVRGFGILLEWCGRNKPGA